MFNLLNVNPLLRIITLVTVTKQEATRSLCSARAKDSAFGDGFWRRNRLWIKFPRDNINIGCLATEWLRIGLKYNISASRELHALPWSCMLDDRASWEVQWGI